MSNDNLTYPYLEKIATPAQRHMSDKGTIQQLNKNISGLKYYIDVLVSGSSGALGNKFFLKTGAKCAAIDTCSNQNDTSTCQQVDRYIYVDNVPHGNIMGDGLIPGSMGNLAVLNPFALMSAFSSGSTPQCQQITMETITNDDIKSSESNYVTLTDIKNMDACEFSDGINPVNGKRCKESFQISSEPEVLMQSDPLAQLYFISLGVVGLFIFYRLMEKSR